MQEMPMTYINPYELPKPANFYLLWLHVARIREANGDKEGAAKARRNAKMISTEKMRKRFRYC
jgi:hypothetical protein